MSSVLKILEIPNKNIMLLHLNFMVQFCQIQGGHYYAY